MVLLAIGSGRRRVGREFLRDGVGRARQRTTARGGPVLAIESLTTSISCGRRRVEGRGFLSRSMEHIWHEEKSGSRERLGDARDRAFAKPSAAWQLYQVCSLICQVAQNTNSKCKTVGYLILRFFANYKNANPKCKTIEMLKNGDDIPNGYGFSLV